MRHAPLLLALAAPGLAQINDECTGALALSSASPTAFDTSSATPSSPAWSCAGGGGPDLWYTYTTQQSDVLLRFDTCGSTYDTALEVFSVGCPQPLFQRCDDDGCGALQSLVELNVASAGFQLWVRVGGFAGATGVGVLTVTEVPADPGATPGRQCVETLFTANNGGAVGGAVYFDLTLTAERTFSGLQTNTSAVGPVGLEFHVTPGGYAASAGDPAAWTLAAVDDGTAIGAGQDERTAITFAAPFTLPAGTHGVALVGVGLDHDYTNGGGVNGFFPSPDGTLVVNAGAADNTPFSGAIFAPRIWNGRLCHDDPLTPGVPYCGPARVNSTGQPGVISASGSDFAADNEVTLHAAQLPLGSFGFFLVARQRALVPLFGGSQGDLCLGGALGRYDSLARIQSSRGVGAISLAIDLTATPTLQGPVAVQAGETWNFQCWYRDVGGPAAATSNFTDALEVTFR